MCVCVAKRRSVRVKKKKKKKKKKKSWFIRFLFSRNKGERIKALNKRTNKQPKDKSKVAP
jgi:hypothetical protein